MMPSSPLLLATYGTLRRAAGGPERLDVRDRLSFVTECRFDGELYDLGRYPGAIPGDDIIRGELFRLQDPEVWTVLDRYEGYAPDRKEASLFVRRQASLNEPADHTAWVYWYNGDPTDYPRIPSGDWVAYVDEKMSS